MQKTIGKRPGTITLTNDSITNDPLTPYHSQPTTHNFNYLRCDHVQVGA
ncbi:MAG: hypothetical protein ABI834_06225 [Ginsengibacter sp.]